MLTRKQSFHLPTRIDIEGVENVSTTIATLRSNDADGNENVKKQ